MSKACQQCGGHHNQRNRCEGVFPDEIRSATRCPKCFEAHRNCECDYDSTCISCGEKGDPEELARNNDEPMCEGCRDVIIGRVID